ncbi:acetolactate synthase small subunit [Croceicoccus estronivorus]|uniref:acetolactate synthase small subunit n=1 Tax=Croceicoccus estronivorus TaxID=1172626 RepID=UPI00082DAA39|nr:acetolactate synthase small subunit [Croceicoccus estronivorus]OCC25073.1 acetolactate synthase small subunit [Croceicoccus estronivorus]
MKIQHREIERHVLTITVDNEAGILAKIAGLFTARGYNIDSLTVADISENHSVSRITIVTHGPPAVIDQIHAQLERLVPVHRVTDLTEAGPHVERELALIKVSGTGEKRVEALRVADVFRAKVIDTTTSSFIFELTGAPDKIDSFVAIMRELGLVEVGRTGIVGMMRGGEAA